MLQLLSIVYYYLSIEHEATVNIPVAHNISLFTGQSLVQLDRALRAHTLPHLPMIFDLLYMSTMLVASRMGLKVKCMICRPCEPCSAIQRVQKAVFHRYLWICCYITHRCVDLEIWQFSCQQQQQQQQQTYKLITLPLLHIVGNNLVSTESDADKVKFLPHYVHVHVMYIRHVYACSNNHNCFSQELRIYIHLCIYTCIYLRHVELAHIKIIFEQLQTGTRYGHGTCTILQSLLKWLKV